MEKYITKEQLTDFVQKMWDAGIRVELKPSEKLIQLWSDDFNKHEYVYVGYASFEDLVDEVTKKFKEN